MQLLEMDERLEKAPGKVCVYLFMGALAVRVLYLSQYAQSPFFWVPALDSLYHDLQARAIAAGHPGSEPFFRAPLYYYMLGGIYRLFGHSFWAARLIQATLGAASCVLLYQIGRRVFRPTVGLIAGALMALYGPLVFFDGELLTPVLEVFLDLAFLWLFLRAADTASLPEALAAGVVLGLSAITRPNVVVVTPLFLVGMWRAFRGVAPRRGITAALLLLVGAALAPALVTLRNASVSGDPVFIASQGGINLFLGNRPEADGFTPSTPRRYRFDGPYEDSVALYGQRAAEEAAGHTLTASQAQSYWTKRVIGWWCADPGAALRLTGRKWVLAWTHREIRNNHAYDFVRAELAPFLWFCASGFWFAGPFGLLGMALAWRGSPRARLLVLFVLVYVASFVLFFVADRYRLPVVPLLLLFGAHALVWGGERIHCGETKRLGPAVGALAALALFVNVDWFPTASSADWARDLWSAGNRYREMGLLPEAAGQYRRALALDPGNPEIWLNLGAAQYGAGRVAEASTSFHRVLHLAPTNSTAFFDLAMCELQRGSHARARGYLERAIHFDPADTGARAALARLCGHR